MMNRKSWTFVLGMGVWTAVTLAGSIFLIFSLPLEEVSNQTNLHFSRFTMIVLVVLIVLFVIPMIGGGLWGLGMAKLAQSPMKPMMKAGALSWGATVLATGLALYFSQIPIAAIDKATDFSAHDAHYLFTLVFVSAVGVATMANGRYMAGKLGFTHIKKEVGRNSGLAAAITFLVISPILLFGLGWEVGRLGFFVGYRYRYSMIVIMHFCNFGAALAGGLAMGWTLVRGRTEVPMGEVMAG